MVEEIQSSDAGIIVTNQEYEEDADTYAAKMKNICVVCTDYDSESQSTTSIVSQKSIMVSVIYDYPPWLRAARRIVVLCPATEVNRIRF